MAINSTILLTNVAPVLHLHGFTIYDMAALYAVANRENQSAENILIKNGKSEDERVWDETWSRTGAPRLAFDRGVSVAQMRKALAKTELSGLIQVKWRGSLTALRRVNRKALDLLQPEKLKMRELASKRKHNPKFNLGPLDWTTYLGLDDGVEPNLIQDNVDLIRLKGPVVWPYQNAFERDMGYLWAKKNFDWDGFQFERFNGAGLSLRNKYLAQADQEKRPNGTLLKQWSCLMIKHPHGECPP